MWRFVEDGEFYLPVSGPAELPEKIGDLRTAATFVTQKGEKIAGYIVGADRVFAIGLFVGDALINFNKNLPRSFAEKQFAKLSTALGGGIVDIREVFPLVYETCFNWEELGYKNLRGEFAVGPV